jgi:ketosteroid isomerase-like protein
VDRLSAVRGVYREWERGNYRAGLDLYDPAITLEVHNPIPEAGIYEGLEGLQRYMRGFLETWDEYEIHATALEADGDLVIADVHHRGRASEALVEMDYVTVWTFQGDRVARVDIGRDRDRVVAAASRHSA